MKRIRNTTHEPVRVPLGGGKVLHLGPAKEGQVAEESLDRPAFRKLVEAGTVEILGEGSVDNAERPAGAPVRETTHGHPSPTVVTPKGNR